MNLLSERELNQIAGKMLAGVASVEELNHFLRYVSRLEGLLSEADLDDYFGTEGWHRRLGWDD